MSKKKPKQEIIKEELTPEIEKALDEFSKLMATALWDNMIEKRKKEREYKLTGTLNNTIKKKENE